jgi:MATE family multidrug resistance protein
LKQAGLLAHLKSAAMAISLKASPVALAASLRLELRPLLRLAVPVVFAEVGWMAMWIVDTIMVGRVSAEAIGAVSLGGHLFHAIAIFGIGMLLGLDYMVAHAFGARRLDDANRALIQGVWVAAALTLILTAVVWIVASRLEWLGIQPTVLEQSLGYVNAVTWGLCPLLLFAALRRYLQAMNLVRPIMFSLISANLINLVADWIFIFGHFGLPAMGAEGAGWATCVSRLYMLGCLVAYVLWRERGFPTGLFRCSWSFERQRAATLVRLGTPAALQTTLEVGVFAAATALAGMLESTALAAHQIALSAAALTFMVPLGISSAAAVRVGQSLGARQSDAARRAGWTALLVGSVFMSLAALAFLLVPAQIIRVFTNAETVVTTGVSLLAVAALFQLFDGLQVVATGALRGTGDTRTPMICNLLAHWFLGLPVGYALCFWLDRGVIGLWFGLSTGLIVTAVVLVAIWSKRAHALDRQRVA